ncbi:MAG: hypothetical protein LBQ14_09580, partial [Treponema sp.]|nr:hypothetical protein [Treponema sp.]
FLLPDHDPDIERYFYLRSTGRSQDALYLYQARLKPRYPDDDFRIWLMRCYRSKDPAYKSLLARAYRALGERSLERIKRIIFYIAEKADNYNKKDVYSTIKAAEDILVMLPSDRYEAVAGIERFLRYAQVLNFYEKSLSRAADLVRSYLTESLSVVEEELHRRENVRLEAMEQERRRLVKADWEEYLWQKKHGGPLIDLSAVTFSPADLARIEIPRILTRIEDQTLAYCVKYWNLINDAAFERILFLYSRKYGTRNYDVFLAIRRGVLNKSRDDEILASVMSALVTGYYYSIQGDIYLQRNWNILKASLQQRAPAPLALPPPAAQPGGDVSAEGGRRRAKKRQEKDKKALFRKEFPRKAKAADQSPRPKKAPEEKPLAGKKAALLPPETGTPPVSNQGKRGGDVPKSPGKRYRRSGAALRLRPAGGSVADRLRELSGRSYDLYQDRFLAKTRLAIRKALSAGRGRFFTPPEKAEDLIYDFLRDHYADPYMNWKESAERAALRDLGFELESLIPIIDECYKSLFAAGD